MTLRVVAKPMKLYSEGSNADTCRLINSLCCTQVAVSTLRQVKLVYHIG